jgi:hypothetical protein
MKRKPTRHDLLVVIDRLQDLIGKAALLHGNDRNQDGFEQGMLALKSAEDLCHQATGQDPPVRRTGPWSLTG